MREGPPVKELAVRELTGKDMTVHEQIY